MEAAIVAARLVARSGARDEVARAWQEALRRDLYAELPRQELASIGCDLFFAGKNDRGVEEFESAVDGATLDRIPSGERRPAGATRSVALPRRARRSKRRRTPTRTRTTRAAD